MIPRVSSWNRSLKIAVLVTVTLTIILIWVQPPSNQHVDHLKSWISEQKDHAGALLESSRWKSGGSFECPTSPGAENIVVTVKTGASEAALRIPNIMSTSLRCPPNIMLFSDMQQTLGEHILHDALADIPDKVKEKNSDFNIYRAQQKQLDDGWIDAPATEKTKNAAWTLDKYKNLHILQNSWDAMPNKEWYVHLDADTYLVWPSLLNWLASMDPSEPLYIGSLTCFGNVRGAHGGSGIVTSGVAVSAITVDNNATIAKYDAEAHRHCCGDELVARAMLDNDIPMHNAWPTINGESLYTIYFGSKHWCEEVVTLHHMTLEEMEVMAEYENRRPQQSESITYQELFRGLMFDMLPDTIIDDWDGGANDKIIHKTPSMEDCLELCENEPKCFQVTWNGEACKLATKMFRYGQVRKPKGQKKWQSAWKKDRIWAWAENHTECSGMHRGFKDNNSCG